jgi:hypothetical protein
MVSAEAERATRCRIERFVFRNRRPLDIQVRDRQRAAMLLMHSGLLTDGSFVFETGAEDSELTRLAGSPGRH